MDFVKQVTTDTSEVLKEFQAMIENRHVFIDGFEGVDYDL